MDFLNCFQIVVLFAAAPTLINWLSKQNFEGSNSLFYLCCCIYITIFLSTTIFMYMINKEIIEEHEC